MPQDKMGIEIQQGDVLAMVDTYKGYPPVLCVADNGFTPQYTRVSYIYLYGDVLIKKGNHKTRHLIVLSEEQVESLVRKMISTRLEYQQRLLGINENLSQYTEEEMMAQINELIEYSREIKERL